MNRRERRAAAKVRAADAGDEVERLFRLALDYHRRRAYGDAEAIYGKIYAKAPSHFGTLNGLGDIYLAQRRWGDAAKVFRQAVARDPGYAPALNNLGFALQSLGDLAESIGHYRQAIASRPGYFDRNRASGDPHWPTVSFDKPLRRERPAMWTAGVQFPVSVFGQERANH